MSKTEKTYCSLYTFIKRTNPDLYEILDDMCAVGLFRTRNDITFLNPSDKLTNQLIEMVEKDQSEEAFKNLKSLFIYGKHNTLNKDVVSYNNKNYGEDLSGLKQLSAFKQWKDSQNVSVFDYKSDKFPKEGESAERPPMGRKGKGKKGRGEDDNAKVLYTAELMKTEDPKKVIYALNSLVKSLDDKMLKKVKSIIDPNMILTWYIIVQPGKTNDEYISNDMFNEWTRDNKLDNLHENTDVLKKILNEIAPCKSELMEIKQNRATASENSDSLEDCQKTIKSIYQNNMTKLLEDELRFRYSDETHDDMFKIYIGALNIIDWNSPSDNLVLLNDMCGKMQNNAVLSCLAQFIKSSAFDYTLLSDGMCEKLSNSISGAGSGKGKKMIKMLGNKHREMFKNIKSVKTVEKIESLLSHLSAKERAHLKSMM